MNISFISVGAYIPEEKITSNEMSNIIDTSDSWIYSHTGIKSRYFADKCDATSYLGVCTAELAVTRAHINKKDVHAIIVATSTPDYLSFPATACVIQNKLAMQNCLAYDLFGACTGFIHACFNAIDVIHSGLIDIALVMDKEIFSRIINFEDRNTCILFGDGAGAAIISSKHNNSSKILARNFTSDSSDYTCSYRPGEGSAENSVDGKNNVDGSKHFITMNGRQVYSIAIQLLVASINDLLQTNKLTIDDIDYIVPHQANYRIIAFAARQLHIPTEKFFTNIKQYANTFAASISLALFDMEQQDILQRGMKIM